MTAPELVFDHLRRLTDGLGLFEHALGDVPRPEHGYCVDDAARALVLVCRVADASLDDLLERYLTLVTSAVAPDGRCHNRLGVDGRWQDEPGLGDWWGRAVWGLGVVASTGPVWARQRALTGFLLLTRQRSPHRHAMAYAALGAAELPDVPEARRLLADTAEVVAARAMPEVPLGWEWPEPRLRYDNARLPEALLAAGTALGRPELEAGGLTQLRFLMQTEMLAGHLSVTPVGGRGPRERGPAFDQQPIEVAGIADACARALMLTGDPIWREGIRAAWAWFTGDNDRSIAMYEPTSGGGYDGLEADRRNFNRGAESTLAALTTLHQARTAGVTECLQPLPTTATSSSGPISRE